VVGEVGEEMGEVKDEEREDADGPEGIDPSQRRSLRLREIGGLRLAGRKDRTERRFGDGSFAGNALTGIAIEGINAISAALAALIFKYLGGSEQYTEAGKARIGAGWCIREGSG
jgi:hypothetical protein